MGSGEEGPIPQTTLQNGMDSTYRNWFNLTKGIENYIDLRLSFLGLGGKLCRRTTLPRLYSITNDQRIY